MMDRQPQSDMTYFDAHSHLHDHLSVGVFLSAARDNFRRLIPIQATSGPLNLMLCLADYNSAEGFFRLGEQIDRKGLEDWCDLPTEELTSLLLEHYSGDRLWVIAGRQIVTAEKLEVMGLGLTEVIQNGLAFDETLHLLSEHKAMSVLPWGVGKWWGRRGRIVAAALERYGRDLPLCDNGGRPWLWRPRLLATALHKGLPVLSGSDPLQINTDCLRSGSFGICLPELPAASNPTAWLISRLRSMSAAPTVIGRPSTGWLFIRNQIALRRKV